VTTVTVKEGEGESSEGGNNEHVGATSGGGGDVQQHTRDPLSTLLCMDRCFQCVCERWVLDLCCCWNPTLQTLSYLFLIFRAGGFLLFLF
jgi:hypothetical protein